MLLDILIIAFAISALYRGREIGFVRQLCATAGFFGGLFLGAWLQPHVVNHVHNQTSRSVLTVAMTLGMALILLLVGEYVGLRLKHRVLMKRANRFDVELGSVLNVISLLISAWLLAAIIGSLPIPEVKNAINNSRIITVLDKTLPEAPGVISRIGSLIDPNGFPQVFIGSEPTPRSTVNLPSLGELLPAVEQDRASVVKVEGQGCGGIVDGSGFIVASGFVATNAHVVAGIAHPYVIDASGTHRAQAVWFDPNLDFAILRVDKLSGKTLPVAAQAASRGTAAAVLGYPGGGPFSANVAAVLDRFTATGRNIYDRGNTTRDVYEVQATVIPGNSGGPLITKDGTVVGVIFAESTSYNHVGYALTAPQLLSAIQQATSHNQAANTGRCAE